MKTSNIGKPKPRELVDSRSFDLCNFVNTAILRS